MILIPPPPELIRTTRDGVLQTQTQAAATVYAKLRTWQRWEAGDRAMPRATWELYLAHHCAFGGLLRASEWEQWLRPQLVAALRRV